jgi:serine/threonine-protein kinase
VALIGSGASAQVYLADDVKLHRHVAVKLLHPMLADDLNFNRRFEAEARRAAGLSHANVVAVYDWGDDDGPYLVTEYLGGGSLGALLDSGRRLSPSQALLVGLDTARGLEYAHAKGLVHRDVKPANLLFSSDGRLRVADFGVARALAEAALTEPTGPVPGTVRYAAPEQARGRPVGPPGEVYALALVLVEAVTGEVPFTTDTTVGTLMARVERPLTVDESFGPLREPLEAAGRLDPDERPDIGAFALALLDAARELPAPGPLPLAGAAVPFDDDDPTLEPVRRAAPDDNTKYVPTTGRAAPAFAAAAAAAGAVGAAGAAPLVGEAGRLGQIPA